MSEVKRKYDGGVCRDHQDDDNEADAAVEEETDQDNKDGVETMTDYDASHHGQYGGSESVFVHKFCYDDRHADEHHSVVAMATTVLHLLGMLLCSVYYCADAEPVKPEHTRPQPSFI